MFWSCVELAHFASSLIALVFLEAQDAWLAVQVLATEAFGVRQSLSKEALVRQSVVGWVGAALSELGKDACWVRRTWEGLLFPTHTDFAPNVTPAVPMVWWRCKNGRTELKMVRTSLRDTGVTVTGVPWSLTEVGVGWNTGRRRSRICCRAFLSVVANQCSWACFFSESVALAHTLGHTSVHWRTRLLFHHQHHFKANQTRHRDPLEYQRPPCAHSRRTSFLFGSLQHQAIKFRTFKTNKHTHTLT